MANTHPYGWQFIDRKDASASATIDFVLPSGFLTFRVYIDGAVPATDDSEFWCRLSDDAGVSYEADVGDYEWAVRCLEGAGTDLDSASSSDTEITLCSTTAGVAVGSAAGEGIDGELTIYSATLTGKRTTVVFSGVSWGANDQVSHIHAAGSIVAAGANDAVRFLFESGNITSGTFSLYGMKLPGS